MMGTNYYADCKFPYVYIWEPAWMVVSAFKSAVDDVESQQQRNYWRGNWVTYAKDCARQIYEQAKFVVKIWEAYARGEKSKYASCRDAEDRYYIDICDAILNLMLKLEDEEDTERIAYLLEVKHRHGWKGEERRMEL